MNKLTPTDLMSLETYARERPEFRARVLAHKANRRVALGPHLTLHFEDRLTIQYQVQEMLRIERIFEPAGIEDELAAYNPLIPDGTNLKATLLIEYDDVDERREALRRLKGIEKSVWLRVAGHDKVRTIANEDLERENQEKTAAVHFVRFELTPEMIAALQSGTTLSIGVDHPEMTHAVDPIPDEIMRALVQDFSG